MKPLIKYLLLVPIIASSALCCAQVWTQKGDFGGITRSYAVAFSIGSKGYVGTGYNFDYKNDFWEYDPATDAWTQKANFGGSARYGAVGFSIGSKGYVGTGWDGGNRKDFWEYDPLANSWTQKNDFGGVARNGAVGFTIGSKGYVGTGDNLQNDFWEYDPTNDLWSQQAYYPGAGGVRSVGIVIASKGYVGTGNNGLYMTNDFWEYDPTLNAWTQKANFGGTARMGLIGFSIGTKAYAGGGVDATYNYYGDFWEYDPANDLWSQQAGLGGGNRQGGLGFSIGSKGYTGIGDDGSYHSDFWEFAPALGCIPPSFSPTTGTASGCAGNVLGLMGGSVTGTGPFNYHWQGNDGSIDSVDVLNTTVTGLSAGPHQFVLAASNACGADSLYVTATVHALPQVQIVPLGPTSFCQGGSVVLGLSSSMSSQMWNPGGQTTSTITVTTGGAYSVTGTDANGCSATSTPIFVTTAIPTTWYADADGDGYGDAAVPVLACDQPAGHVATSGDNCPNTYGLIGSSCNDGDPNTTNDVLNANCACAGTPTGCTANQVSLTLSTDANASQTTWDIVSTGTTTVVCTGGGYASSSIVTVGCCLPNGCYDLRVFDGFGDGLNPGGYVLRDANNQRIIDNTGNGAGFTSMSSSPSGFCVPLGTNALMAASCDVMSATYNTVLRAELDPAVIALYSVGHPNNATTGYQYWVTNPNGGYSRRIVLTHAAPGNGYPAGTPAAQKSTYFKLSSMSATPPVIPYGLLLNVRVRPYIAGVYGTFGRACRLYLPQPPCLSTQLTTGADPVVSCGATGLVFSNSIYATAVQGATGYQFEFSRAGYLRRIASSTRSVALSFITSPLQYNTCYQVRIRVSYDNSQTYCPFGPYCTITMGTASCNNAMALDEGTGASVIADEARLSLWPNPNDGSTLNISLTAFDATVNVVSLDVTDVFGKLVATRTLPVQDGRLNTAVNFVQELAPGLYLVNLTAGEHRYTERLVIQ